MVADIGIGVDQYHRVGIGSMRSLLLVAMSAFVISTSAGCTRERTLTSSQKEDPRFYEAPYDQLRPGMTYDDVIRSFGKPSVTNGTDRNKIGYALTSSPSGPHVVIWFEDGRMVKTFRYDAAVDPRPAKDP